MSAVATAIKSEIQRVARKEIRTHLQVVRKATIQHRHEIASLKRQVRTLEQQNKLLRKAVSKGSGRTSDAAADTSDAGVRFSAAGLRSLRARLELSAPELGRLLSVSPQSIYNWEQQKATPRSGQVQAIARLRSIGKRAARAALDSAQD